MINDLQTNRRWLVLFLLFVVSVITYVDRVNISIAGSAIAKDHGLDKVQLGTIFSAFVLGYALLQTFGGWLGDRFGFKKVLMAAIAWWSVFTVLTAFAGNEVLVGVFGIVGSFALVRFLIGIGEAAAYPCASGLVSRWFPQRERGRATGIIFAGIGVGSAITPPLVAWIVVHLGWPWAFYITGAIGLIFVFLFQLLVTETPAENPHVSPAELALIEDDASAKNATPEDRAGSTSIFRNPQLWILTISYFFMGYVGYIFLSWFFIYLTEVRGFPVIAGSFLAVLPFVAMAAAPPLGGFLNDHFAARFGKMRTRRGTAIAGLTGAAIFLIIGSNAADIYWAVIFLTVAAGSLTLPFSSFWATVIDIVPKNKTATASGFLNTGTNLGGAISPTLTPIIAAEYGWTTALSFGAACCLIAAGFWVVLGIRNSRNADNVQTMGIDVAVDRRQTR